MLRLHSRNLSKKCFSTVALIRVVFLSSAVVRRLWKNNRLRRRGKRTPEARDGWFKVTVTVEVSIKVTAVMLVHFCPQSCPWLRPSFHPRRRGWNVMKLNCSRPPFAASVRRCLALLSSLQSLSPFSSQAGLSKSPFGWAKVWVCVCVLIYCPFHRVFWCPLAESFPDSGSVGLFDSCNLSRPGQGEIRVRNLIKKPQTFT